MSIGRGTVVACTAAGVMILSSVKDVRGQRPGPAEEQVAGCRSAPGSSGAPVDRRPSETPRQPSPPDTPFQAAASVQKRGPWVCTT